MDIFLSISTTPVIDWIARLLGWIMNGDLLGAGRH